MPDGAGVKNADLIVHLVREESLLLCAVLDCQNTLSLATAPAPADVGWSLEHGWWFCAQHVGWMSWLPTGDHCRGGDG